MSAAALLRLQLLAESQVCSCLLLVCFDSLVWQCRIVIGEGAGVGIVIRQSRGGPRSSLFPGDKFRRRIRLYRTIRMSMVPVSPRGRSPSLANRLLLLSSVHQLQDGRLVIVVTRQCHGSPETIVVAPGFSQRVGNVIVRVALTRDSEDKNLLRSCECCVFQQKKSTQRHRQ